MMDSIKKRLLVAGNQEPTSPSSRTRVALFDRSEFKSQSATKLAPGVLIGGVFHVDPGSDIEATIAMETATDHTNLVINATKRQLIILNLELPHIDGLEAAVGVRLAGTASVRAAIIPMLHAQVGSKRSIARMRGCTFDQKPWSFAEAGVVKQSPQTDAKVHLCLEFHATTLTLTFTEFFVW